ncbi:site-specific integrase [Halodesulfovibrio sp.]|uniref:tyrosine-type recombinase/integrase n=1 Tax=Halodesulfovibrio sp. TaxID=1912772 RepID=UPI0025FEE63A|nr:site-specific integrase [Halodesulfovibrio sp.]
MLCEINKLKKEGNGYYYANFEYEDRIINKSLKTRDVIEAVHKLYLLLKEYEDDDETSLRLSEAFNRAYEERYKEYADSRTPCAHIEKIISIIGDTKLKDISARHLNEIQNTLKREGKTKTTINRYMAHLSVIFTLAKEEWEVLSTSPRVRKHREKGSRTYILNMEDEKRLFSWFNRHKPLTNNGTALDGWHYADFMMVLLHTGLRLSEGIMLRVGDIQGDRLNVRAENAKSHVARTVPLSLEAQQLLVRRSEGLEEPEAFLFDGMKKDTAGMRMRLAKAALKLDHTDLGWHSLRHTCATRLLRAGADIVTVQSWLGHADIMTTRRYLKLVDGALDEALANMLKMFGGKKEE